MTDSSTDSGTTDSPGTLACLETAWMESVCSYTGKFRWVFPYWSNTVEVLAQYALYVLVALPVITVTLLISGLSVGYTEFVASMSASSTVVVGAVHIAMTDVEVAGVIVTVLYLSSVLKYHPIDKNDYLTVTTPTNYDSWETMLTVMTFGILPTAYFSLRYFEEASVVMEVTGLSAWVISWMALLVGYILFYRWMNHRYGAPQMDAVLGYTGFYLLFIGPYMALIAFDIDILVYGAGVGAAFAIHFAWMVVIARRLRWTMYTDWAGFSMNPHFRFWGVLARGPLAFAVYVLLVSDGFSLTVAVSSFSPLVAAVGYIAWRAYVTGDLKKPARGRVSAPGRARHKKRSDARKKQMKETEESRKAVVEFNEFATEHGLSTLTEPEKIMSANPEKLREELKAIHEYEARALTGDAYDEYMDVRETVRDTL